MVGELFFWLFICRNNVHCLVGISPPVLVLLVLLTNAAELNIRCEPFVLENGALLVFMNAAEDPEKRDALYNPEAFVNV